ncbi:MAG: DUF4826 family protein [Idiomarina sp.]|nr:DUF4826 family protein [Idiomarina sp.]
MDNEQPLTEEQRAEWVREQFQAANAYLSERGILTERVLTKESRYLAPVVALWKFSVQGTTEKVWAISGSVPSDHIEATAASNAREALKYFCMRWQMRAFQIETAEPPADATQQDFARILVRSAEGLMPLVEQEDIWTEQA